MRRFLGIAVAAMVPLAAIPGFFLPGNRPLDVLLMPVQAFFIGLFIYHLILVVSGVQAPPPVRPASPRARFAILIAAHNEESVVPQLIASLKAQDYPRALFTIFVVADRCTDGTATAARDAGAAVVERSDGQLHGKGPAIECLLQWVWAQNTPYDAVVIFDADNLAAPTFLSKMNAYLQRGDQVIQGYLGTKNPDDSWMTRAIYASYAYTNRFFQLAKENLGLSSSLGGTGLCIAMPLLRRLGWRCEALTEDLEFQMCAILHGVRPTWGWEAVVYDEKPLSFTVAWRQRRRWMQGHASVAVRYLWRLLGRALRTGDPVAADAVVYLGMPIWLSLALMLYAMYFVNQFVSVYTYLYPVWVPPVIIAASFVYPYVALHMERLPARTYVQPSTLGGVMLLSVSWPVLGFLGLLHFRQSHWVKTVHTRSLSITETQRQQDVLSYRVLPWRQLRLVRVLAVSMMTMAVVGSIVPHLSANKLRPPLEEGGVYLLDGEARVALEHFQAAAAEQPEDAVAYGFLAVTYRILGNNSAAFQAYQQLRRRDPELEETVVALTDFFLRHRRHPNSGRMLEQVMSTVRSAPAAYAWVANLFIDRNRIADAEHIVGEGLRRVGPQVPLLRVQGFLHFRARRYKQAADSWHLASAKAPRDASLLINLGWAYVRLERLQEAIRVWQQALTLDPTNAALRKDLAWVQTLVRN